MASERVMAGLEKKLISTDEEKRVIAVHESGHAVSSWFLEGGDPLLKVNHISLQSLLTTHTHSH